MKQFKELGVPTFVSRKGNPHRRHILEGVRRIREGIDPKPRTLGDHSGGFGGVALAIPELDYAVIQRMFPDVTSQDPQERTNAWKRFLKSPLSEPYRLDRKTRGPQCRSLTAR